MSQFSPNTELLEMLSYARPHGSAAEAAFVNHYIGTLPNVSFDKFGNGIVRIGTAPVLWSSHTDTVHAGNGGRQRVAVKGDLACLAKPSNGAVLGADDSAGVWLMCEMIRAERPGLYVFHAGEEVGGLGSGWLAENRGDLLRGIDYAIAFDRKGTDSVITHQGGRSCSDKFASGLASRLNGLGFGFKFKPDDTGLFTDTANYTDLVGECSNISVGYEHAHSCDETLDLPFVFRLRDALLALDVTGLPTARQAGDDDPEDWLAQMPGMGKRVTVKLYDSALIEMVRDYPEVAAQLSEDLGANADNLKQAIWLEGYAI